MSEAVKIKKKSMNYTHPFIIIFSFVVIASILTYIIPAGQFDRGLNEATGRTTVLPGTYHSVESNPATLGTFLMSFFKGLNGAAPIMAFLLLIGGAFGVVNATGSIEALMAKFIVTFKTDRSKDFLIAGLVLFFGICAGTFGMALESLVFVPFLVVLMVSVGFDALVGIAIPILGVCAGYGAAFLNPFSLGIAQGIAGLPLFSGMGFRIVWFIVVISVTSLYLIRYANMIRKNPERSLCYGQSVEHEDVKDPESIKLSKAQIRVLLVFGGSLLFLMYGAVFKNFFMGQAATLFLFMGIIAGAVYGMKPNDIAASFVNGAKDLVMAALLVGFARAIIGIFESAHVLDSIVYYAVQPLHGLSPVISAPFMALIQMVINFFIFSGSGQAMVTMPIMSPMAEILGVNKQVAVLAFQIGDGFSNGFWVTSGLLMAGIAATKVKIGYGKWLKFVWKLFVIQMLLGMIAVAAAQMMNWGPF